MKMFLYSVKNIRIMLSKTASHGFNFVKCMRIKGKLCQCIEQGFVFKIYEADGVSQI